MFFWIRSNGFISKRLKQFERIGDVTVLYSESYRRIKLSWWEKKSSRWILLKSLRERRDCLQRRVRWSLQRYWSSPGWPWVRMPSPGWSASCSKAPARRSPPCSCWLAGSRGFQLFWRRRQRAGWRIGGSPHVPLHRPSDTSEYPEASTSSCTSSSAWSSCRRLAEAPPPPCPASRRGAGWSSCTSSWTSSSAPCAGSESCYRQTMGANWENW